MPLAMPNTKPSVFSTVRCGTAKHVWLALALRTSPKVLVKILFKLLFTVHDL